MLVLLSVVSLLVLYQYPTASFRAMPARNRYSRIVLKMSGDDSSDMGIGATEGLPSLEELFGGKGVKYVLNNDGSFDADTGVENMMIKPSQANSKNVDLIEIPIMPFESPLFPGAREFLYIYEMRFRSLMNDVEKNGNKLGRCFISDNGAIGSIGSFCSIFEKRIMDDGKGFFIIEANSRFRIRRIIASKPYLRAQVELIDDVEIAGDSALCEKLCKEVYCELKTYLRIAKLQNADEDGAETIGLSPAIRDSRPLFALKDKILEIDGGSARHKAFSHACANLLATEVSDTS
jgi:ATP-dependent protease La (LON) substrate-binding domain